MANGEWFVVRLPFWPTWFRLAGAFQLLLLVVTGCCIAYRGLVGMRLIDWDDVVGLSTGTTAAAVSCVGLVWFGRWTHRVVILPYGVQMHWQNGWVVKFYRWARLVRVTRWGWGVVSGRWLKVWPDIGPGFVLPLDSLPIGDLRDVVERFAGPDHPLTVALGEAAEGV